MSKNDDDKDDISVRCRSGLSDLDLDLINRQKDEAGTYSLATLLEIRLSFQHYRCETFANCFASSNEPRRITSASTLSRQHCSGYPTSSSTHHNLSSLSQAPLSPKAASSRYIRSLQSLSGDTSGDHLYCCDKTKLLPPAAKSKSSAPRTDFHVLFSKLTRFRRRHLPAEGVGLFLKNRQKGEGNSDRQPILAGDSFSSSPGSGSISSCSRGALETAASAAATTTDDNRQRSGTGKVKSTSLFNTGKSKHVHTNQQRCARLGDAAGAHCSVSGKPTYSAGPRSSPSFEITSGPLPNHANSSSPDCSSSSRTASHLTEAVHIGHIPPNTQVHSSSLSFSNISSSYSSLLKDPSSTHQTITAALGTAGRVSSSPVKHSQLDFRSISEYSFIHAPSISHFIKSDVCSLPIRMDDQITSKMLDSSKSHFGESQSRRMPSYVSISRAISGYSNYNQYSSDLRRDNSLLDSLLPSRASSSRANGDHYRHHHHHAQRRPLVDDQVDNFCSLPYEPTQEKVVDPSKSFLQKKIESLYGQTFAEDWKKSRGKSGSSKSNSPTEKTRSPSCPPSRISRDEAASGSSAYTSVHPPTINSLDSSREDLRSAEPSTVSNVIEEKGHQPHQDSSMECNATQDGHWFLRELKQCKTGMQAHVDHYESVLTSTEDTIPEEIIGKIRAIIGKANLLMNKKLNQFNQLCLDSIAQRDEQEFKINPDDLQGFWDMVTIQVDEINGAFDDLDVLRQNNWTAVDEETISGQFKISSRKPSSTALKHNSNSPRSVSKLVSPMNSPKTSKTASPNGLERETERKLRLMEIKRKGKMKARERSTEEEITIFMPTSENDLDK